jgi:AraC-like DNA-binding protein
MPRLTHGGGPHAWPLLTGSGYVLGRFDCPPHAERWHAVDWIGEQPHVVLPGTAVRIGAVGEEPGVCTANEVIVYDRDTHYRRAVVSGEGDRCTFVAVGDELAAELCLDTPGRPGIRRGPCPGPLYVAHRRIRRELEGVRPDLLAIDEAVLALLAGVAPSAPTATREHGADGDRHRTAVDAVRALLAGEPTRRWRLAELAATVHYSPYCLARMFRRHTGYPIAGYRRELCLRESLPLALDPAADLSSIAVSFGFSSHSHYTHAFHKTFGCTPSQARRGAQVLST